MYNNTDYFVHNEVFIMKRKFLFSILVVAFIFFSCSFVQAESPWDTGYDSDNSESNGDSEVWIDQYIRTATEVDGKDYEKTEEETETVTSTETETDRKQEYETYVVRNWYSSKDCLWNIAKNELGDPNRWPEIVELNKDRYPTLATNPGDIKEGWELILPKTKIDPEDVAQVEEPVVNIEPVEPEQEEEIKLEDVPVLTTEEKIAKLQQAFDLANEGVKKDMGVTLFEFNETTIGAMEKYGGMTRIDWAATNPPEGYYWDLQDGKVVCVPINGVTPNIEPEPTDNQTKDDNRGFFGKLGDKIDRFIDCAWRGVKKGATLVGYSLVSSLDAIHTSVGVIADVAVGTVSGVVGGIYNGVKGLVGGVVNGFLGKEVITNKPVTGGFLGGLQRAGDRITRFGNRMEDRAQKYYEKCEEIDGKKK